MKWRARGRIGGRYSQLINATIPQVTTPRLSDGCTSVYAQYTIEVPHVMTSKWL